MAVPELSGSGGGARDRNAVHRALRAVRHGLLRFPVTVAMLLAAALRVNWPLGAGYRATLRQLNTYDGLVNTGVLPLLAGAVLALAAALYASTRRWGQGVALVLAAAAGAVGFALLHWHVALGVYFGSVLPAIGGMVLIAPYLRRGSGAQVWRYLMRLGRAAFGAGVAASLFGGGVSLVLLGIDALTGINVLETTYFRVWSIAFLVAGPLVALAMMPRHFEKSAKLDPDRLDVGVIRYLMDLLIVPFLLVYAAMLHLFALTALLGWSVPDGETGFFVLAFGISLLAAAAVASHFAELSGWPTRLLLRIWPWLLPVPVILLFVSGAIRIADVGVTPERYLFVLFGVVLAVITALQLFPKTRGDIRYLLIVPVTALFVASFGPQGALAVSIRSQTERFKLLVKDPPYTPEEARAARTALYFLDRYEAIGPVVPSVLPDTDNDGDTALRARVAEAYGLNEIAE